MIGKLAEEAAGGVVVIENEGTDRGNWSKDRDEAT
jgi:hypothetical protein